MLYAPLNRIVYTDFKKEKRLHMSSSDSSALQIKYCINVDAVAANLHATNSFSMHFLPAFAVKCHAVETVL